MIHVLIAHKPKFEEHISPTAMSLRYLLTPWCRVLEKLTGLQLVNKFPAFHGTRRFITALTSVSYLSLSWASPIQSIYPHPTSWRSILILSTHLRLGLPRGLFPSGFPTKNLQYQKYQPLIISTFLRIILTYIIWESKQTHFVSSLFSISDCRMLRSHAVRDVILRRVCLIIVAVEKQ